MYGYLRKGTVLLVFGLASQTFAADIQWSGFMSFAAGKTLEMDDVPYLVEPITGGSYDRDLRFDPESVVGIQAQSILSDRLRATVQVIARGYENFNAEVEWAYASYDLTHTLTLNAGRFRLPLFYYSDTLDVGYAYYWVRPPVEVYRIWTATLEGANLFYSNVWDDFEVQSYIWYGNIDVDSERSAEFNAVLEPYIDMKKNQGINIQLTYKWATLRLLYNTADIEFNFSDNAPAFLPREKNRPVEFKSIAFMADYGNFLWRSEYTHSELLGLTDDVDHLTQNWYASIGYQVGDFTPHFTHAEANSDSTDRNVTFDQETDTIGMAWNFEPRAIFKLEYTKTNKGYDDGRSGDATLISTALDILF